MSLQNNVMIDLETTGVAAGCCILSIGACTLDLNNEFYQKISIDSCYDRGLRDLSSTLKWWNKQDPAVMTEAFSGVDQLAVVLIKFSDWFNSVGEKNIKVWGNGADFDLPILGAAYIACGMEKPWKPYNGRCFRTIKNLYPDVIPNAFRGIKHNALEDAKNQAIHLVKIRNARGFIL